MTHTNIFARAYEKLRFFALFLLFAWLYGDFLVILQPYGTRMP